MVFISGGHAPEKFDYDSRIVFTPRQMEGVPEGSREWKDGVKKGLRVLKLSDVIFMNKGWEDNRRAKAEYFLAKRWGKKVEYDDGGIL